MGATLSSLCSTAERGGLDPVGGNQLTYMTFCYRVRAIDTLYEVKMRSASDADNEQWKCIYNMIREMSKKTLQALESSAKGYTSIFEGIERVSNAFDTGLLSYLQPTVDLMGELGHILPKKGQSWEKFLKDMNPDCEEEDIFQSVKASAGREVLTTFNKRTTELMSAIKGNVKKSGVLQSVQEEKKIKVFYATDRHVYNCKCTSEPGKYLQYGFQQVSIPGKHKRGKVESPIKYGRGKHSEHFMLEAEKGPWSKSDEFLKQIERESDLECAQLIIPSQNSHSANDVASATGGPQKNAREVLLYIHGYTVSHKDALKGAAQLKNDLEFGGVVILYSWPTMGQPLAYHRDGRVIKGTARFLHEFITTILGEVSFSKVHILAHSMGNRALIAAMSACPYEERRRKALVDKKGVLKNVILAAADETLENFEVMLQGMLPKSNRPDSVPRPLISVYSSACDWPLFVSGYINWHSRLGNTDSLFGNHSMLRCDQHMVDVIDASGVRCDSPLQHSYHAEAPEVLDDIQKLLTEHKRAGDRPCIGRLCHNCGQGEWVFHAFVPRWWEKRRCKGCFKTI
ncbi:unnamed protein product [Sphagnum jensenii]|uniref:Uncharacterized protein n=1 Tax=Sphagnum jensenii TaxID=128206 RepID=A0ABP0X9A9_9BRYO